MIKVIPTVEIHEILEFLNSLTEDLRIGDWYGGTTRPQNSYRDIPVPPLTISLNLELTLGCNLRCIHCYAESDPELVSQQKIPKDVWKRLIREAAKLNCRGIGFTGGEPLLVKESLFDLIRYTREAGIPRIGVSTNATLVTAEVANFFAEYNVEVAASLYAANEQVHDSITTVQGSCRKTVDNLLRLKAKGIPIQIKTPVMLNNQDYLEETEQFVNRKFGVAPGMSLTVPVGRACSSSLAHPNELRRFLSDKLLQFAPGKLAIPVRTAPDFSRIYKDKFATRVHGHACFRGFLCITPTGHVLPCLAVRQIVLGNVQRTQLSEIVSSNDTKQLWGLSKDFVKVCQDCEYRYACFDCQAMVGKLVDKPAWCRYDPYTTTWQDLIPEEGV